MQKINYVPSDVIGGVFYYLYENSPEKPFFCGDLKKIHETFYNLRTKFSVLKIFPFSVGEVSPFSRLLEEVLQRLELSRVIGMENPDFTRFMVKEAAMKSFGEIIQLFNEQEKKQLNKIAKEFQKGCPA